MTYPDTNPGRRAELLRAAYGMNRALGLAEYERVAGLALLAGLIATLECAK